MFFKVVWNITASSSAEVAEGKSREEDEIFFLNKSMSKDFHDLNFMNFLAGGNFKGTWTEHEMVR